MKRAIATSLCLALILLSPGLEATQAFAKQASRPVAGNLRPVSVRTRLAPPARPGAALPRALAPRPQAPASMAPPRSRSRLARSAIPFQQALASRRPDERDGELARAFDSGPARLAALAASVPEGEGAGGAARLAPTGAQARGPKTRMASEWGAQSPRVGVKRTSLRYYWMRGLSGLFDFVNRFVTWDKLPTPLGVANLAAIQARMRLDNYHDAEAYPSSGYGDLGPAGASDPKGARTADGSSNDQDAPAMGAARTRFGDQHVPRHPWTDFAAMDPSPREVSNALLRRERFIPAKIVNVLAAAWIQFMVHDWMNHERAPMRDKPIVIPLKEGDPWPRKTMTVDRTAPDPTRADKDGPPTFLNSETHWWDLSMIYGSSLEVQKRVRSFSGGRLRIDPDGRLPEDPQTRGVDLTGFNQNYWLGLSVMHTLFAKEHNAIAEALRAKYPDWDDQRLFDQARLINSAFAARIHTVDWTRAILPNATLQVAMLSDWYGLVGKRFKLWLMDQHTRRPWLARLLGFIRRSDLLFGAPGTPTDHFTAPYAMTNAFTAVYRMHPLLPDAYEIAEHATGRLIEKLSLAEIQGRRTRGLTQRLSWEDVIASFGMASAGALTLNNFPETLRQIRTQDGRLLDLAAVDILRERERGMLSYQQFREMVGKPKVKTFLELTGGDEALARKISDLYKGDLEKVDLMVGLFAEPLPAGFGFSDTAFRIFIAMAPRRLKSDRFLSEQYDAATYTQLGIDWIEHNTMATMMVRHHPELRAALEGLDSAFKPWPARATLHERLVASAERSAARLTRLSLANAAVTGLAAAGGLAFGLVGWIPAVALMSVPALSLAAGSLVRRPALDRLRHVSDYARTERRSGLFRTLFAAESGGKASLWLNRIGALAAMDLGGMLALKLFAASAVLGLALWVSVLAGWLLWRQAKRFGKDLELAKVGLYSLLQEGQARTGIEDIPGGNSLERHGYYFSGGRELASFGSTYRASRDAGLGVLKAFSTAFSWHVFYSKMSQKNMSPGARARLKPGPFDNYIPGFADTQGPTNTRIYTRGEVDMAEFERIFREFAVGRDYVTMRDLARLWRANADRDAPRLNWFRRLVGKVAFKKRFQQLMIILADRVVWEDGALVPAISREGLLRFYEGGALYDIREARTGKP